MKTLIFSDTHFTCRFDKKRFDTLKNLISSADKVIINGDFWDGVAISFDEFLSSPWSGLFPLLKVKQTIYIYGNHDLEEYSDERVNLFSDEQKHDHSIFLDGLKIIIEHGHRLVGDINSKHPWLNHRLDSMYKKFFEYYLSQPIILGPIASFILKKYRKNSNEELHMRFENGKVDRDALYIFGHTHIQLDNREHGYIVLGEIFPQIAQYAWVENNKIELNSLDLE